MKTAVKTDLKSKTFCVSESYTDLIEKETSVIDSKFYQKLFILIISFSTILIFPESPRQLANICESYNSIKSCDVW
jgi:hypothetical protein